MFHLRQNLAFFISGYISGEASVKDSFLTTLIFLVIWSIMSRLTLEWLGPFLEITAYVLLVNIVFFTWGALAIYGASLTSHAITISLASRLVKFAARFLNWVILLIGIAIIMLVASGQLSWMTYLSRGIYHNSY